jgi:hypothetical protein
MSFEEILIALSIITEIVHISCCLDVYRSRLASHLEFFVSMPVVYWLL